MKKNKIIKKTSIIISLAMVMLLTTGCLSTYESFRMAFFEKQGESVETIKIGVLEPRTGKDSSIGADEIRGIQIANELYPEVLGKKIELVYADTQSDMEVAETAVKELVNKEPVIVLGGYGEAVSLTASSILRKAHIPAIGTTSTNPLIVDNNDYYYRVSVPESRQGRVVAEYITQSLNLKRAALVKVKGEETTNAMISRFVDKMGSLTGDDDSVADIIYLDPAKPDYLRCAEQLEKSGVRAVFMATSIGFADEVMKALEGKMANVTFIGPNSWHNDDIFQVALKHPSFKIAVVSDIVNIQEDTSIEVGEEVDTTGMHNLLVQKYKEKYETDQITDATALAFDAYLIAVKAIEKAEDTDASAIKMQLDQIEKFKGASGKISFNEKGEASKPLNIDLIELNKFVTVYTSK